MTHFDKVVTSAIHWMGKGFLNDCDGDAQKASEKITHHIMTNPDAYRHRAHLAYALECAITSKLWGKTYVSGKVGDI